MINFLTLSTPEQLDVINTASSLSGKAQHILEKDIWVVWSLEQLFNSPFADHLVFKGGTSLSKAYKIIDRFSEDVDITYSIHAIAPDLMTANHSAYPCNKSQEKRWSKIIRERLSKLVMTSIAPYLQSRIQIENIPATLRVDKDKIYLDYPSITSSGTGYTPSNVMLEFGARSTGEPSHTKVIDCDASTHVTGISFPSTSAKTMWAERTFLEKATCMHVFCHKESMRGRDRFTRHWHDITRLDRAGIADRAIKDHRLKNDVADHKKIFFTEKAKSGKKIDYHAALTGGLNLIPSGNARDILYKDYQAMIADRLFPTQVESFEELMFECESIQHRANQCID